ncbi:hypothetical protein DICVIV_07722 [Dictyocaulus viviparus]|uniref:Uncharacterized protein n=1 Tax=Dictyocaulus viviparus TaxID=29172 RepID=A0A0D8XR23_DICVI|nr:hypothetical protein DICVIV_07722 [Dictyocaulus viviparus]
MLGASSLDPSASPWHSNSASAVGHPPSNSRLSSKSSHSPKAESDVSSSFTNTNVKEEFPHIEPVASTSGRSGVFEESVPFEADANQQHSVAKVKVGDDEAVSVNEVPPVQPLKIEERRSSEQHVERRDFRPTGAHAHLQSTTQGSGSLSQPPGYHIVHHQQEVGSAIASHPIQRPPAINNNSPLLVNLLSSQQQSSIVGGANIPPHHQSFSPAGSYMYPGNAQTHQHPHPSNVPQSAPPPVMDPQQHMAMQQQMQMEQRQRIMMQQQQAHAAAVAAVQAQQHSGQVPGQTPQGPLTSGGFYNSTTPIQATQPQQRSSMVVVWGYVAPQNPVFVGQPQVPQQVVVNVQPQRIQGYPAHLKPNTLSGASPVASSQFRGPVEETVQPPPPKKKRKPTKKQQQKEAELAAAAAQQQQQQQSAVAQAQQQQQFYSERMIHPAAMNPSGMQIMTHSGYPASSGFSTNPVPAVATQYPAYPQGSSQQQQHIWHQQMQQRIAYQQHVQASGPNSGHNVQLWSTQRGPPVPYPVPMGNGHDL